MSDIKPFEAEDSLASSGEMKCRGTAHPTSAQHNDVVSIQPCPPGFSCERLGGGSCDSSVQSLISGVLTEACQ